MFGFDKRGTPLLLYPHEYTVCPQCARGRTVSQDYFRYAPVGFEATLRYENGTWFVLMGGNLDTEAADNFFQYLKAKVFRDEDTKKHDFVIDMEKVDFVSSTGIGVLLAFSEHKNKSVKLICRNKLKNILDRHLGGATKAFFELKNSLSAVLTDKDLYGRDMYSQTTARLLKVNKADLAQPTEYRRKELSIIEMAVGKDYVRKEVERMESYLKEAVFSDHLNIKSHKKYALPHYLFLEKALKGVGVFPSMLDYESVKFISLELVENSYEHGYNRDGNRLITVDFGTSEKGGEFFIRHTDYGKGFMKKGKSIIRGKGLSTIKNMFEDLGGTLSIEKAVPPDEKTKTFIKNTFPRLVLGKGTSITLTGDIILV